MRLKVVSHAVVMAVCLLLVLDAAALVTPARRLLAATNVVSRSIPRSPNEEIYSGADGLAVGDLDGAPGFEVAMGDGCVTKIYRYSAAGDPSLAWTLDPGSSSPSVSAIAIGDVDSDGQNELVVANAWPHDARNAAGNALRIYRWGSNAPRWTVDVTEWISGHDLAIGDGDNDGSNELVVGLNHYGKQLRVYEHTGGDAYVCTWTDHIGSDVESVCISDVDNDGQNEILAGTGSGSAWDFRVYGWSGSEYTLSDAVTVGGSQNTAIGDVDGDGKNEIVVTSGREGKGGLGTDARIYKYPGPTQIWDAGIGEETINPIVGDMDNDGLNEFALFLRTSREIRVYKKMDVTYSKVWSASVADSELNMGNVAIADVEGDGLNELLLSTVDELHMYDGMFNAPPEAPLNVLPSNATTDVTLATVLQSSPFSDPNSDDSHAASQWQVRETSTSYSSPVYDSGTENTSLTIITVPSGLLRYSTAYCWHVRYQDNQGEWSDWSTETYFRTKEKGGIPFWIWAVIGVAVIVVVGAVAYAVGSRRMSKSP